jgi:two-component system nitrate/nitrite response regulator NarL
MLGQQSGFTVVGVRSDRREGLIDVHTLSPDVAVIDMAPAESHATVHDIQRMAPSVRVIAIGVPEVEQDILRCAEAGVAGYVCREASLDDLICVVQNAMRASLHCSPEIAWSLMRRVAALSADRQRPAEQMRLTVRESEIVALIEHGLSNKEIAGHLGIEVATVKNHVHNLLEKLNVHRRTQIARVAGISSVRPNVKIAGQPFQR